MKYRITMHNDWSEKYWMSQKQKSNDMCRRIGTDSYEVDTLELCIDVVKEFMDAPSKRLTAKDVRKDFEDSRIGKLTDKAVDSILAYYNGRLDLLRKVLEDISNANSPCILKYDMPSELNNFTCYQTSLEDEPIQNEAWLKVEICC